MDESIEMIYGFTKTDDYYKQNYNPALDKLCSLKQDYVKTRLCTWNYGN
jgi:hypothetical protein